MGDEPIPADAESGLDGAHAERWIEQAVVDMTAMQPRLDALNVFPVADSDTGTNMLHTLRAGTQTLHSGGLSIVMRSLAKGTLLGARGNSGVILAAYLGGMAESLEESNRAHGVAGDHHASAAELAAAFANAASAARASIADPAPGTALSAGDAAAAAARALVDNTEHPSVHDVRDSTVTTRAVAIVAASAADQAVVDSTAQLEVLRDAGVPDAGAAGLAVVLGALATVLGAPRGALDVSVPERAVDQSPRDAEFEVMFVVHFPPGGEPSGVRVASLRRELTECGGSVAVVEGSGQWHAHVHTNRPVDALSIGRAAAVGTGGRLRQVLIHSLENSGHDYAHNDLASVSEIGTVVVTGSPGLIAEYARTGAVVLVVEEEVGADELVRAITESSGRSVVVLPAIPDAALAARGIDDVAVHVVDTPTDLHVVAALAAAQTAEGAVVEAMANAAAAVRAVRLTPGCDDVASAVGGVVHSGVEVLTMLHGVDCGPADLREVTEIVERQCPGVEIVVLGSGRAGRVLEVGVE